jgi:hypothetical protein
MGGCNASQYALTSMEVFDSKSKQITKVMDDQNNWLYVPVTHMVHEGSSTCAVPLIDKNAFILSGGRLLDSLGRIYIDDVIMFHTDTR